MSTLKEIAASMHEPEHRLKFRAQDPPWDFVTVSGHVEINTLEVWGASDDDWTEFEVHMWIGPWWQDVQECVPSVWIDTFDNADADEDDWQGYNVKQLKWATDGEGAPPNSDEVRVRLEFIVRIMGESSYVRGLGYRASMGGRRLGKGGHKTPGPVFEGP
jgi:hypothetical protein